MLWPFNPVEERKNWYLESYARFIKAKNPEDLIKKKVPRRKSNLDFYKRSSKRL